MNHPNQPAKARREDLVVQELPDEVLVYDLRNHKAHCLNQTAAFVWNHCDGQTTAPQLAALMEKEWGAPVSEDVVWLALKQLSRTNLLEEHVNVEGMRSSRRAVLRKLGAAAALTPLVISIVAPTASAGSSIPTVCTSCIKKITSTADCGICLDIQGACFDNSGCGQGGFLVCQSCGTCFGTHGATTTVSWVAPGTGFC